MGFMDKVKDSVKSADEKLGNAIDKEKIDSDIRKEERNIADLTKEIGEKVVAALKDGKDANSADISCIFEKIGESEKKICDLKAKKDAIGKKDEESKE